MQSSAFCAPLLPSSAGCIAWSCKIGWLPSSSAHPLLFFFLLFSRLSFSSLSFFVLSSSPPPLFSFFSFYLTRPWSLVCFVPILFLFWDPNTHLQTLFFSFPYETHLVIFIFISVSSRCLVHLVLFSVCSYPANLCPGTHFPRLLCTASTYIHTTIPTAKHRHTELSLFFFPSFFPFCAHPSPDPDNSFPSLSLSFLFFLSFFLSLVCSW